MATHGSALGGPMKRRALLRLAAMGASAAPASVRLVASMLDQAQPQVKRVLIVFKCHLDVGFTQTQAQVMRKYFDIYYPAAIRRATELRAQGTDRYIWSTGSWLMYEYLDQADSVQRRAMEKAIAAGDVTWHALPFSWQTEMLDRSMIAGGLGFSAALDARFGRKTIGAKMTDVPGHSRGIIAPLQGAGVRLLDIGINAASVPPEVPDAFLWKDAEGNSLAVIYHRHDYGSVVQIPGSDLAISVEVRNDNSGPHTRDEITAIYARLRSQFPGAMIEASNLNEVAHSIEPYRGGLPVVSEEIGDTWIYGIPSDPIKVARYCETSRMRRSWIEDGHFVAGDAKDRQLLRRLLLAVEHTWGTDTKTYLDNTHYRPADLAASLGRPGYLTMLTSWQEKRDDIDLGIASLPPALREEVRVRMKTITAAAPSVDGLAELDPKMEIEGKHYLIAIDRETGAITKLVRRSSGREWASPESPLALVTYQTLSAADFADFLDRYVQIKADWAPRDFGKPGIQNYGATSQEWHPKLIQAWTRSGRDGLRIVLHLRIVDKEALARGNVAWPGELYLEISLPHGEPAMYLQLTSLSKGANRMPEAMWFSFVPPDINEKRCTVTKVDKEVALTDVVRGGGRSMHAVNGPIKFGHTDGVGSLEINTLDAPVIALGTRSPLNYSPDLPDMKKGIHVCLFNNAWGTNYPQWGSGEWLYRFTLRG